MAKKKFVFNDFYYQTRIVDFNERGTVAASDILAIAAKNRTQDKVFCEIKYDVVGYDSGGAIMINIDSRFYIKKSDTDNYSIYEGKSVFHLDNEYPANFVDGKWISDYHSRNGTVWNLGVTVAELAFQHLSKHVGYIYSATGNTILIEIPSTYGIYANLFHKGYQKNEWTILEEIYLDWIKLADLMTKDECESEFEHFRCIDTCDKL